jgi:S1-C subfamily serine protease
MNTRNMVFLIGAALLLLTGVAAHARIKTYPRLTTVNGVTYENVDVSRIEDDFIYVIHESGGERISFAELPDAVLKDLGLPTREATARKKEKQRKRQAEEERLAKERGQKALEQQAEEERLAKERGQKALEAERKFEEDQQAKGMVKYQEQWKTPAEIKEIEAKERNKAYSTRADELVLSKFKKGVPFKIIQSTPQGALCKLAEWDRVLEGWYYTGETFFMLGVTSKALADGEKYKDDLYWAGTHTYTTVQNIERTVNSYSYDRDLARLAVIIKFNLYDQQETETTKPSPAIASSEPILADTELKAFGSGFLITKDGFLLTNHHVVSKAKQVKVKTEKGFFQARIVSQDPDNDIALLKIEGEFTPVSFAADKVAKLGQTIFTVGFPMPELQGFSPKVTKGVISSMNGIQDDVRMYQIDAAVQPGNSGGPLADENGNILGVVVARINDAYVAKTTGTIAQNVNYAVKKSYTMAFVDNQPDASKQVQTASDPKKLPFEDAVERIRKATVLVMVY